MFIMFSKFILITIFFINTSIFAQYAGNRNNLMEYKGPVFLIKETENINDPFTGAIVEGGIELIRPTVQNYPKYKAANPLPLNISEPREDPEYFAILVTPDTVSQSQISRSTSITVPLNVLLIGATARIPWLLVLKKINHYEYFRNLQNYQLNSLRRRSRHLFETQGALSAHFRKYELLLYQNDVVDKEICTNILEELLKLAHIDADAATSTQLPQTTDDVTTLAQENTTTI